MTARSSGIANTTIASVPKRDRHIWSLFDDWCTAHDRPALTASPESLAEFLRAHPAAPATQRRRVAIIDAVHFRHDRTPPGRAESVRAALDATRTARLHKLSVSIGGIIDDLPESCWPSALFARRDALILALASTGLPYAQIAGLRVCDVTGLGGTDALRIETCEGASTTTSPELLAACGSPMRLYRRWLEVLGHCKRHPSTGALADAIERIGGTGLAGFDRHLDPDDGQPLLTPIDRWGHTPLPAHPACDSRHRPNAPERAGTCPSATSGSYAIPRTARRARTGIDARTRLRILRTRNTCAQRRARPTRRR